jgi:hypothetical protein
MKHETYGHCARVNLGMSVFVCVRVHVLACLLRMTNVRYEYNWKFIRNITKLLEICIVKIISKAVLQQNEII